MIECSHREYMGLLETNHVSVLEVEYEEDDYPNQLNFYKKIVWCKEGENKPFLKFERLRDQIKYYIKKDEYRVITRPERYRIGQPLRRGVGDCKYAEDHNSTRQYLTDVTVAQDITNKVCSLLKIPSFAVTFVGVKASRIRGRCFRLAHLIHLYPSGMAVSVLLHEIAHEVSPYHGKSFKKFHDNVLRAYDKLTASGLA